MVVSNHDFEKLLPKKKSWQDFRRCRNLGDLPGNRSDAAVQERCADIALAATEEMENLKMLHLPHRCLWQR